MRQIQRHHETYFQLSGAFGIVEGRTSERDTRGNLRNVSLGNSMSTTPALATLGLLEQVFFLVVGCETAAENWHQPKTSSHRGNRKRASKKRR